MPLMPDSYVTSAKIVNGKIQLEVQVDQFAAQAHQFDDGQYVEISGQATQTSGAFANIYDIQQVPAGPNGDPEIPDEKDHYYVYVSGAPIPHQFREDGDVTVVLRAARVWLTVLGSRSDRGGATSVNEDGTTPPAPDGTTWDRDPRVVQLITST
jgi:hypothetical protein